MLARADIGRRDGSASRAPGTARLPQRHVKALDALAHGRPAARGGPVEPGLACDAPASSAPACTNRPGPPCPPAEATPGLDGPRERLLPGPSGLVTWPRPAARRPVARSPPRRMSHRRFPTSAAAGNALAMAPPCRG